MPTRPPTITGLTRPGFARPAATPRPSPSLRGYGRAWQRARLLFLAANPYCLDCEAAGLTTAAEEVDHVQAIAAGGARFDWNNLRPLCKRCHSRKTCATDGGLGLNPKAGG